TAVQLFRNSAGVIVGHAVTGLAIGRTDAVAILGDFHGHPVEFRQGSNQSSNHTGFANAARMPANHHYGHANIVSPCSKSAAKKHIIMTSSMFPSGLESCEKTIKGVLEHARPEGRRTV